MERRGRKPAEASEDITVSKQGHGLCILGHARNFAHRLSSEAPSDQQRLLHCLIGSIGRRNQEEKASHGKEETAVSTKQCTGPQVDENDGEIERSTIRIASPHIQYSPDLAPSDFYLFADLKKMLKDKRFSSDDEIIATTEDYFEAKYNSFYKKSTESLEKRWNACIAMEGDYVDE